MSDKPGRYNSEDGRLTELRPGIGLCDDCGEPRWPQTDMGYGTLICADCRAKDDAEAEESEED